ncbi:hypothetical protein BIV57_07790 [Mangrovactinospora gilvigrisea]|uniref:ABC transporter domain-containing protein n=1 Tax=Mangrovactinospora gilvigrisea TaxID=1428644 RepID=A0A1J7CEF0_9ACTN|nr:ABC transporter ATP-binding protein [Mangrovactinospora gilvigrisea]OIV38058.1 hypothetical protein BIV57_07790 [Mangrovactinospora gilvigrisea]
MAPVVRARGVAKQYGRRARPVLYGIDLEVAAGEVVAVRGANGSGKSTLLRILAGLTRPTAGTVDGRPRPVGWVPERFPPSERLSAAAYLVHQGRIRGLRADAARERAARLLERLALAGGAGTPMARLSKGNAQKVALAQAVLTPPALLVLDEPWSGLDAPARGVLAELIAETAGSGGAVVLTDHGGSASPTAAYLLEGGRLAPAGAEAAPLYEIVLGGAEETVLKVPATHRDAVLSDALARGRTVLGVRAL